jgi:protein CpxP
MNKVKLLSIFAIVLLITNLISLVYIFKNKPGRGEGPKDYVIEKLNFDEDQINEYQKLIDVHRTIIRQSDQKIHALKSQLYIGLNKNDKPKNDSLINAIAKVQIYIENTHCNHFKDIQSLCKPGQIKAFDALLLEMSDLFSPRKKPRR